MVDPTAEELAAAAEAQKPDPAEAAKEAELAADRELAGKYGWTPQDEFKGPEDEWKDADSFLLRPNVQRRVFKDELDAEREARAKDAERIEAAERRADAAMMATKKATEAAYAEAQAEFAAKQAELEARAKEAVRDADEEEYDRIQETKKTLKAPAKVEIDEAPPKNGPDPVLQELAAKQAWIDDVFLREEAFAYVDKIIKINPGLTYEQQFDVANRYLNHHHKEDMAMLTGEKPAPTNGNTPPVRDHSAVDEGGLGAGDYAGGSLPQMTGAELAAAKANVQAGIFKSVEEAHKYAMDLYSKEAGND